ncbi:hypothetical protein COC42_07215 [Sphingomonas spermidinifaciens]|uniref:Uncharacterized protein n=1 Tax=Sphingomonas spermidinifaciens TaxID=1141889 RepID=A0A2A4B835_9SPHN|nr:DUF6445 family protein [Sphingomonas spermidinifaciens]PCD04085.1 hypothetical protein COC42_07215 [Sphingomonas spermidinifaciens]
MSARVVARRIGREREPIAIADDFHPEPAALRTSAHAARFAPADRHYPGVRAPLGPETLLPVRELIAAIFAELFGRRQTADVLDIGFSIVATPPARLSLVQRLPHVDAVEPGRIAMVLYLFDEAEGGTAFYRHRATGFETLDPERSPAYFEALKVEVARDAPPAAYPGSLPQYEVVDRVPARFNRAVFYRSRLLHSGIVTPATPLVADPRAGRLTITGFFDAS